MGAGNPINVTMGGGKNILRDLGGRGNVVRTNVEVCNAGKGRDKANREKSGNEQ